MIDLNLPQHRPEVIPHAAQSLRDIEIKAQTLDGKDRLEFLQATHDGWCELYNSYVAKFPLEDPSDFILMVVGIRRLMERI
jgi:hypothetical protein